MKFNLRNRGILISGAAAALAGLVAVGIVSARRQAAEEAPTSASAPKAHPGPAPAGNVAASARTGNGAAPVAATEEQKRLSRAMDKTMVSGLVRSYVSSVDAQRTVSADRLKTALISYKDVSREVIDELTGSESHLSEAARAALKEIYDSAH